MADEKVTVTAAGRTWERYRDRGAGCWHPVDTGYPCRSLQALIDEHGMWTVMQADPARPTEPEDTDHA